MGDQPEEEHTTQNIFPATPLRNNSLYTIAYTKSHSTKLPFAEIKFPLLTFTQVTSDLRVYQWGGNAEKMSS